MKAADDFLKTIDTWARPIVEKLVTIIQDQNKSLDAAVKWGQLTFGVNDDYDHWVCAITANKKNVNLKFHFGSLLHDAEATFTPEASKFIRKIQITSMDEINEPAIRDLLSQAETKLPHFRSHWQETKT